MGVGDVMEYLARDEWEMALLPLEDLGNAFPQPPEYRWRKCAPWLRPPGGSLTRPPQAPEPASSPRPASAC